MRIFSAQLFKLYALFLVAIATVALGAPLVRRKGSHGSLICSEQNAITKRADIPFEERCPEEYSLYIASLCSIDAPNLMLINCAREDEPDVIFDTDYTCEDDEICIDRTEFPETPHAFCIKKKCGLPFDNFVRPDLDACGSHSYSVSGPVNLVVAMMTYSTEMNPIQVNYQNVKYKGDLAFVNQVNNFTRVINGYNGENIDFCFNGGTTQKVQAFAAAWITD
ncbi:hypothetical protein RhiirA5_408142 [Rhizophagus irregularis]|uniref:Uncharacterized protein n=1 Tax=Rhizophagus irregularis TaxID=588596 RepID=A0A2I1ETZ5_9GLOM|nr:hypothetical protein RhiirA5_501426 [Rhizophagus irregularis]PKC15466.1 hypothetical protein RhiirA5_408142 [Rhizophagus irregularis]PKC65001.1 hypothetical protein RhiirA1_442544 [Rhizophagus irregularis]PKY25589.1 hypothetical protein RhiirB3_528017 [Rhizophagus irregularis]CAB4488419.1 unnamed protein product [Rhizophagus irregularis]